MSNTTSRGVSATVVSLRAFAGRKRAENRANAIERSPRTNLLLGELSRTWQFVQDRQPGTDRTQGRRVGVGAHDPAVEQVCRRMMQSLGRTWSSKIVSCERGDRISCVLFVWRDDVINDPVAPDADTLWILEPGCPRVRSVDIENDYSAWSVRPSKFIEFLCGRRSLPA